MRRLPHRALLALFFLATCLPGSIASAETGILVVHVEDVQRRPIVGLQIALEGEGGSPAFTQDRGTARVGLAKDTKSNTWVSLQILKSPVGKDYVMVSPWDYRAQVPSFENETENFVKLVVVQRGDRAALESGSVLAALTAKINKANAPKTADKQAAEDPKANLDAVARQFGLTADDLDKAIRAWGTKTTDPYDVGLAALYARNYDAATSSLQDSLKQRERKFATAQKDVADAAFFLGQSLYGKGKYRDSAAAFQRCLQIRPDDATVLNDTALSLFDAGDYAGAEPLYLRALAINEQALGPGHPDVAIDLNNLAALLDAKGDYAAAEPLFRRALAIDEKALGPDHPVVAIRLNNLAGLLKEKGDYAAAEPLLRRTLAILEKTLGPDHPQVATALNNLAEVLRTKGDNTGAEPLYRRALAIDEKALGSDHPDLAIRLNNLALLLYAKGNYSDAEPLLRRALAIDEKALGPDHSTVATMLNNLGLLLKREGDYPGAEPFYRRALAIDEKALGPDHPDVGRDLNNLAMLLEARGDYAEADPLYRRAVGIDEKALGPDHPTTQLFKSNLNDLLKKMAQTASPKPQN
jgi:tetratricopeptide (TPR) repeat protein